MKFCPVFPEICRGQVHGPRKERKEKNNNNNKKRSKKSPLFGRLNYVKNSVMIFNSIFNNISALSWREVLLVEDTGAPGENHRPAANQ